MRVIVVYENQIVMAETLDEGLKSIFETTQSTSKTIIRPLEEEELVIPELP